MSEIKIDRHKDNPDHYQISAWRNDKVEVFSNRDDARNVNLIDGRGNTVLTIWGLNFEQMAVLHTAFGEALGICPNMAMEHVRQLHEKLKEFFPEQPPPTDWDIPPLR